MVGRWRRREPLTCPLVLGVQGFQGRSAVSRAGRVGSCAPRGRLCWFCSPLSFSCLEHSRSLINITLAKTKWCGGGNTTICDKNKEESLRSLRRDAQEADKYETRGITDSHFSFPCGVWAGMGQKVVCLALPGPPLLRSWYKLMLAARACFHALC